jgi:hypothetical protein
LTELGQREVRCELPAAEPHRRVLAVHVADLGHRVAGHLARVALAEPLADEKPGRLQPSEELRAAHLARPVPVGSRDRVKPALNAFAITFGDRFPAAETY